MAELSLDGKLLAAGTGEPKMPGSVTIWDLATRKVCFVHTAPVGIPAVAFSPDGKTLAIGLYDFTAKLLDAATGDVQATLRGHTKEVRAIAYSADGKTLATASWDHTVKLWDVASRSEKRTLSGRNDQMYSAAFSPDSALVAAAGGNDGAHIWDAATGEVRRHLQPAFGCRVVIFINDTFVISCGNDAKVRLWNLATGDNILRIGCASSNGIAFSASARLIAGCGNFTKTAALVDFSLDPLSAKERQRIQELLAKWEDDSYPVREAATQELRTIGFVAEPILRKLMKDSPLAEVRIRAPPSRRVALRKPRPVPWPHRRSANRRLLAGRQTTRDRRQRGLGAAVGRGDGEGAGPFHAWTVGHS